jgi:hypothetical protein
MDIEDSLESFLSKPALQEVPQWNANTSVWFYDFCVDVCGFDKMNPQPHQELCWEAENIIRDCKFSGLDRSAILVELPRGCFKTTIMGEGLPVAITTQNPDARGLITTHKDRTSTRRLEAIKSHFEKNGAFRAKYGTDWKPEYREGAWSTKALLVSKRTKVLREPTIEVAAVGADMTGSHYDYIICDDVVQRENVRTQEQRDKVSDYINSLFSLLDPGGVLIVIGTRWHPDDAYGRIIRKDEERVKAGLPPLFRKYIRSCYDGPNGLLFPTEYGHEQLEDIRERIGERNFAANYLNQPVADADKVFKPEFRTDIDFEYYSNRYSSGIVRYSDGQYPVRTTMVWDAAGTKSSGRSDFHGFTGVGTDYLDRWWVVVAEEFKGTVSEVINRAVAIYMLLKPEEVYIDALQAYDLWVEKFQAALANYNLQANIVEAKNRGIPKEERISMLEPRWINRGIITRPGQTVLAAQMDNFSMENTLSHDDVLDSLAYHHGHTIPAGDYETVNPSNPIDIEALRRRQTRFHNPFGPRFRGKSGNR